MLDGVGPGMTAFVEETFGPVAAVVRARDDDHAVELANDTTFGLGASVWGSPDHALAVGRRIRSGALFVNAMVASDPRLPFGGIGRSGYGRELSAEGIREFTNVRTVRGAPVMRFDHVGLNVADLPAMTAWYVAALELEVEFEFALDQVDFRGVMLRTRRRLPHRAAPPAGNVGRPPGGHPVDAALTRGFGHLALTSPTSTRPTTRLLAAGATDRMSPRPSPEPGVRMAFVADPEGNLIELLDRTPPRDRAAWTARSR